MLKLKPPQHEQGFTLTEVLVAILITTVFVATAMQAVVIAAVMRVKAKEYSEASAWIQENLEDVRYQASQYQNTARCSPASPGPNNGYADGLRDKISNIDPETTDNEVLPESNTISTTKTGSTGKTYTLQRVTTPSNVSPYNTLQISYTVLPASGSSIADLYTEVIPDAAFKCP